MSTEEGALEAPAEEAELEVGLLVGDYVVEATLGRGGFGQVVRARHAVLGSRVAIKVLHLRRSTDPRAVARFVREAKLAASLHHPAIVSVHAFGRLEDGRAYQVMELLEGVTLEVLLRERGPLPRARAIPLLRRIADALDALHERGIAHRDFKPANVMVAETDEGLRPKLIDFGIAKLEPTAPRDAATTAACLGTPRYMAPEQCRGRASGPQTDVYAFGLVACETLTGRLPIAAEDALDWMIKHTTDPPAPPSALGAGIPRGVDAILLPLLEKRPEDRPSRLVPVVDALDHAFARAPERRARAAPRFVGAGAVALAVAVGLELWTQAPEADVEAVEVTTTPAVEPPRSPQPLPAPEASVLPVRSTTASPSGPSAPRPADAAHLRAPRAPAPSAPGLDDPEDPYRRAR